MPRCVYCGKEFTEEEEYYSNDFYYFRRIQPICGDCESRLYDAEEEGYFEGSCDECGRTIDIWKEYHELESRVLSRFSNWNDLITTDCIHCCADCGMDKMSDYVRQLEEDAERYGN